MSIKITGLDEAIKSLDELARKAEELDGQHSVPLGELCTPEFMRKYTRFATIDEMFDAGGFKAEATEDFEKIPQDQLDAFVAANSNFPNWNQMLGKAGEEYVTRKLGF